MSAPVALPVLFQTENTQSTTNKMLGKCDMHLSEQQKEAGKTFHTL